MNVLRHIYVLTIFPFYQVYMSCRLGLTGSSVGSWYGVTLAGIVTLPLLIFLSDYLLYAPGFGSVQPGRSLAGGIALAWAMLSGWSNGVTFPSDDMGSGPIRFSGVAIMSAASGALVLCAVSGFGQAGWYWVVLWSLVAANAGGLWGAMIGDAAGRALRRIAGLAEGDFQGIRMLEAGTVWPRPFRPFPRVYRAGYTKLLILTWPLWLLTAYAGFQRFWAVPAALSLLWVAFRRLTDVPLFVGDEGVRVGARALRWDEISWCQIDTNRYWLHFFMKPGTPPLIWKWFYASQTDQLDLTEVLRSRLSRASALDLTPAPIPTTHRARQDLLTAEKRLAEGTYGTVGAMLRSAGRMALRLGDRELTVRARLLEAELSYATGALGLAFETASAACKDAEELSDRSLIAKCLLVRSRLSAPLSSDMGALLASVRREVEQLKVENSPEVAADLAELRAVEWLLRGLEGASLDGLSDAIEACSSRAEEAVLRRVRGELLLRRGDLLAGPLAADDGSRRLRGSVEAYATAATDFGWLLKEARLGRRTDQVSWAWCRYRSGFQREATQALERVAREARDEVDRYCETLALWRMALMSVCAGEWEKAYQQMRAACDRVEAARWASREDWQKIGLWSGQRQQIYEDMVGLCLETPAGVAEVLGFSGTERAFEYVERSKSRALLDLLRAGSAETAVSPEAPVTLDARSIQKSIPAGCAVLEFYQLRGRWLAFLVDAKQFRHWWVPSEGTDLDAAATRLKGLLSSTLSETSFIEAAARRLYKSLWLPLLQHGGGDYETLYIVPHGVLHGLPFVGLHDGRDWLLRSAPPIAYGSSATVLAHAWGGVVPQEPQFVGLAFPGEPYLRNVVAEVQSCAGMYPRAMTLPSNGGGDYPTREDFERLGPTADILHLASHGVFRNDPLECSFQVSGQNGTVDHMTARDVLKLRLKARVLVANVCRGAHGRQGGGDEWLGLLRAFVAAGVHTVVAPRWEIGDEVAKFAAQQFHSALGAVGVAGAIRVAALAVADHERFNHPFHWSSIDAWGDGGIPGGMSRPADDTHVQLRSEV